MCHGHGGNSEYCLNSVRKDPKKATEQALCGENANVSLLPMALFFARKGAVSVLITLISVVAAIIFSISGDTVGIHFPASDCQGID